MSSPPVSSINFMAYTFADALKALLANLISFIQVNELGH